MPDEVKLTKREEQVARAFADGLTHKEIAERLFIAPATVRTHLSTIYRKLEVGSKIELLKRLGPSEAPAPDAPGGPRRAPRIAAIGLAVALAAASLVALAWPGPMGAVQAPPPRMDGLPALAVMPISVEEGNGRRSDLVAALARDIVTGLSQFSTVVVFAADTSFAHAADGLPAREVASRLGAGYVLSADARWIGDVVRIDVQLQSPETAEILWAATYEKPAAEVLDVQREVVEEVVGLVGPADGALGALREAELARVRRLPTESLDAYGHFLTGLVLFETYGSAQTECAIEAFDRAVEVDPLYGRAHAYAGWAHLQRHRNGWAEDPMAALAEAEIRAERATAVDPSDPYGHWTLGAVRLYQRRHAEALAAYREAVELNPNNAEMLAHFGWALAYAGRPDDGVAYVEAGIARNPRHPGWYLWDLAFAHFVAGRYRTAAEVLEPRSPRTTGTHQLLAMAYAMLGEDERAAAARDAVLSAAPDTSVARAEAIEPFRRAEDLRLWLEAMRKAGFAEESPEPTSRQRSE